MLDNKSKSQTSASFVTKCLVDMAVRHCSSTNHFLMSYYDSLFYAFMDLKILINILATLKNSD